MEASALPASAALPRARISIGAPLLRLRSDEQLVALFRAGNEEAFRVIHDRYRERLFAYTRQMLPASRPDAEDALQDIFVRAYTGLRANDRQLALRAWLYRVAHNRCIDELRRPAPPPPEILELVRPPTLDPIAQAERRESLRSLIADIGRLPDTQRSALLMRELGGMSYADMADALAVSVAAVKSLLVRARVGLAQALEARETSCSRVREEFIGAHDRGVRASGMARRHMHECANCREFRGKLRPVSRQLAALVPTIGPMGLIANLLGFGGGAGGAAGGGAAAASGVAGTSGTLASVGALSGGAGHIATLLAAAVATAGGAVEIQQTIVAHPHRARAQLVRSAFSPSMIAKPVSAASGGPIAVEGTAGGASGPALSTGPAGGTGSTPTKVSSTSSTTGASLNAATTPGVGQGAGGAAGATGTGVGAASGPAGLGSTGANAVVSGTGAGDPGMVSTANGTGTTGGSLTGAGSSGATTNGPPISTGSTGPTGSTTPPTSAPPPTSSQGPSSVLRSPPRP